MREHVEIVDPLTLKNRRIVILGLARQGGALARFAAEQGATVVVSDLRSAERLQSSMDALADLEITYALGSHPLNLLEEADLLAVSGGVPLSAPIVMAAREREIPVINDSLLFMRRSPAPVIGITGSAGKTTTTALTGLMGQYSERKTWVGGNIGNPLITHLDEMSRGDLVVQELSSFQLELWAPEWRPGEDAQQAVSPQVAAVLNITPNHLDRHGTMAVYAAAKANILRFQSASGCAVLNADDPGSRALAKLVQGRLRLFSSRNAVADGAFIRAGRLWLAGDGEYAVCDVDAVKLRGAHNLQNVLAAICLADAAAVPLEAIQKAIRNFQGVPHRLELVGHVRGVDYVNDSIATAPERALAALASFAEPLVLLAGGRDKEMRWDEWARQVVSRVRHVVLFGELAEPLARHLHDAHSEAGPGAALEGLTQVETLQEAVQRAAGVAHPGDVVLLAPGGTSYDAFADFEERGQRFRELVQELPSASQPESAFRMGTAV